MSTAQASLIKQCAACGARFEEDALFCPVDGTPLTIGDSASEIDPYLGHELVGQIQIVQLVGVGAMGRVYRAFQKGVDRHVAVKILHRELSSNAQLVTRFHREAKVASKLEHPNVVHVHLTGQLPDGSIYIAMEYLDGMSLQSALAGSGGAIPLPRAIHIALQLSDAVGEAHAQGVVHRDIKPENVMLVRRADDADFVKVLDFGIARLNWGDQSMATAAGLIFGTARYISPEGAQGEPVTPAGDVYSIATLLYQMIAGRTPFDADQAVSLLIQQIHDSPPHIKSVPRAAYLPDPIASVIMQNLAKRPSERHVDARAFGRALAAAARAGGLSAEHSVARLMTPAPVGLASLQRTRELDFDVDAAIASMQPKPDARQTPAAAPKGLTTKWVPPSELQARLNPTPTPGAVEPTLDDDDAARAPAFTERPAANPHPLMTPSPSATAYEPGPPMQHSPSAPSVAPGPLPYSLPQAGEEARAPHSDAGSHWGFRSVAIVVGCLLIGGGAAAALAVKLGWLSAQPVARVSEQDVVNRATAALLAHKYDNPSGECVRDLTNDGLSRWPKDKDLLGIRAIAADEVVKLARAKEKDGDNAEALRLARLAHDFDPTDADGNALLVELTDPAKTAVAPLNSLTMAAQPPARSAGASSLHATLDASIVQPRVGQPVDLVAHVVGAPPGAKIEQPRFTIAGPGLGSGVEVPALSDGGAFRGYYTFLESGRFDVIFSARVGATTVHSVRGILAGQDRPAQRPPPATPEIRPAPDPATPAPSASAKDKWL